MTNPDRPAHVRPRSRHPAGVGALAGAGTAVGFAALHQALISDIWFSVVPMAVAGAVCGGSLAWTYARLFPRTSGGSWARFVGLHLSLLLLLGVVSVLVFDPVVPMAVLIAANEPPSDLIARAMPLTLVFIVVGGAGTAWLWGRSAGGFLACLVTCAALVIFLGLNVSVLGLVRMSEDAAGVLALFFGMIVAIMVGFGAAFYGLERRGLFAGEPAS